jgi:hypothetical protein
MIWNRSDLSRRSAWTKADIRRARQTPLKPLIEHLGYRLEPRPNGNYAICGLAPEIVVKDHYWVRPDTGDAGNAIDFFVRVKGTSFNEAMRLLTPATPPAGS